jgi:HK97 family phage major capsid protein
MSANPIPEDVQKIAQQIKEGVVEAVVPAVTKEVMEEVNKNMAQVKHIVVDKDQKLEEQKKEAVETFRSMYSEIENGKKTVSKDLSSEGRKKDLDTGTATSGEELVPAYFNSEVLRVAQKYGVVRRNARVVPMRGKEENWPTLGNVTTYRIDEGTKITATTAATGQIKLTAKKLAAIIPMTRELIRDANIAVIDQIAKLAGEATAKLEDQWGFLGLEGTEGIFRNTSVPSKVLANGNVTYASADFNDLLDLMSLIDEDALEGMKFYMTWAQFNAFRAKRTETDENYIFQAPGQGMPPTIWNHPVEFVKVMPRPSDAGSQAGKPFLTFANLDYLMLGERDGYEVELSREATITSSDGETVINLWEQDMVAVRVMERIDIELAEADKAFAIMETANS